jgi:hypothetical protein
LDSKEDADAATEILSELGWLRPAQTDASTVGRPASQAFTVNPKINEGVQTVSARSDNTPEPEVLALLSPPVTPLNPKFEPPEPDMTAAPVAGDVEGNVDDLVEGPAELLL